MVLRLYGGGGEVDLILAVTFESVLDNGGGLTCLITLADLEALVSKLPMRGGSECVIIEYVWYAKAV